MEKKQELERELGLTSIIAISMGAMIGSGIFILPGLAMAEAGPSVILAFVLAGVLVFPAAVSICELGTAMPEAGGDYIFIERGLGPGAGTIAGLGTWLMLMFKGSLALVGGMFYLMTVIYLPSVEAVALIIGTVLILINIIGVKQTGGLQILMVIIMVIILATFILVSLFNISGSHYYPFYDDGAMGLFSATVMVLISYGGVTKVAAVAEEIDNPGRNLPLGLLLSLGITTVLYALIVFVLVGIVDSETLAGSNIPMVDAVDPFFGFFGVILIVIAAILALVSTANAGILTASRYPFALSRDKLLPEIFAYVNKRLHTPVIAILVTGGAMLAIILLLPVEEIAKTAGAFQIVVYILVNIALIAFRLQNPTWYKPKFKSPFYPWVQIFGIVSGIAVLGMMDTLPLIGGVGIVIVGGLWYFAYGRQRVDREGIIGDAVMESMKTVPQKTRPYRIIVPIANPGSQSELLRLASLCASVHEHSEVIALNVITVPDQTALAQEVEYEQERIQRSENILNQSKEIAKQLNIGLKTRVVLGRDVSKVVLNTIRKEQADEIILGWKGRRKRRKFILGSIIDPIVRKAPCKVTLIKQSSLGKKIVGNTVVFVGTGPHSQAAVRRAVDLVKNDPEATLTLVNVQKFDTDASEEELKTYGRKLIKQTVNDIASDIGKYKTRVIVSDDIEKLLVSVAKDFNTTCIGATRSTKFERALFGSIPETLGEKVPGTVLIVRDEVRSFRSFWHIFKQYRRRYHAEPIE